MQPESQAASARPRVTVVIPTKDRRDRVGQAIRSATAQEGVDVEVVVVDDGSTDGTAAALRAAHSDVVVVRHEQSLGVAGARNAGIAAGTGEWVAFLDDDDLWRPVKLARQLEAAAAAGARWAYGGALIVDEAGRVLEQHWAPTPEEFRRVLPRYNPAPAGSSNVLVRRDLLEEAGAFDPELHHFADWDLWARLVAIELPAAVYSWLVGYVRHPGAMHVASIDSARAEVAVLSRRLRASIGQPVRGAALPEWIAEGYLGAGLHRRAQTSLLQALVERPSPSRLRAVVAVLTPQPLRRGRRAVGDLGPAPAWARPQPVVPSAR